MVRSQFQWYSHCIQWIVPQGKKGFLGKELFYTFLSSTDILHGNGMHTPIGLTSYPFLSVPLMIAPFLRTSLSLFSIFFLAFWIHKQWKSSTLESYVHFPGCRVRKLNLFGELDMCFRWFKHQSGIYAVPILPMFPAMMQGSYNRFTWAGLEITYTHVYTSQTCA